MHFKQSKPSFLLLIQIKYPPPPDFLLTKVVYCRSCRVETIWTIFSLGLFHEITNRLSCMPHIHVHTPSGDQCQSLSAISSHSAPFSVLISIRRTSRREKVHKLPHPISLVDSSLRLPLSCQIGELVCTPISLSVWQRGRQSQ